MHKIRDTLGTQNYSASRMSAGVEPLPISLRLNAKRRLQTLLTTKTRFHQALSPLGGRLIRNA